MTEHHGTTPEEPEPEESRPSLWKSPYLWQAFAGITAIVSATAIAFGVVEGPTSVFSGWLMYILAVAAGGVVLVGAGVQATGLWGELQMAWEESAALRRRRDEFRAERDRLRVELDRADLRLDDPAAAAEVDRDELHATLIRLFTDFGALDANQWAGLMLDELPVYGLRLAADYGPVPLVPVLDQLGPSPKLLGELLESQFGGGKRAAMVRAAQVTDPDALIEWQAPEDRS